MEGWIKLHRSMIAHWIWDFSEPDKAMAWLDLLAHARHSDGQIKIKGSVITLKRGDIAMSQITLQKRWKWSQNKVKRFLKLLEKEGMIELSTNVHTSIISICNYNKYQEDERTSERADERPLERTADDHPNDDIRMKEGKNGKNVLKNLARGTRLPADWVLPDDWKNEAKKIRPDWHDQHIQRVSEGFRDYWIAKTGKDATKANWLATWRNWCRRDKTTPFPAPSDPNGKPSGMRNIKPMPRPGDNHG